jgi:hypothetical protein
MTTPTQPAAPAQGKGGAQAPAQLAPFRSGTQRTLSTDGYTNSTTPGASSTDLPDYEPSPNNYLRGVWIESKATASGNAATVAFQGDGPFCTYSSITFQDANEKPIVGPFDGYTLMLVNKFGGYQNLGDPRASSQYLATTGSGASGGSFYFVLYVPLEAINRDGLGALQNQSSASTFTLKLTLAASSAIYSTAPTTVPAVVTKVYEDGWWKSNKAGASSTPPSAGTTQYWTRGSYNALSGSEQFQVSQGLGYPIRSYLLVNYDTGNNTRATGDTDFPDPFQMIFKGTSEWQVGKSFWKDQMSRWYSYFSTTADAANGLENGVFVLPYHISFGNEPGDELPHAYKGTNQGDLNQFIGNWTGNSKLFVVANYMAFVGAPPAGANS